MNIHCLALNYAGVGELVQDPLYFLKSTSCLSKNNVVVPYPKYKTEQVWTEVELGILIGKSCENVDEDCAEDYIKGFFVAADLTTKNIHGRDHHLAFSKARTGFCPVGDDVVDLDLSEKHLEMKTYINGNLSQSGSTQDMIYNPYKSVSYISKLVRINEGDIILTGTPSGAENNLIQPNDEIVHTIENIGELKYRMGI